jgi:hypothetical protein
MFMFSHLKKMWLALVLFAATCPSVFGFALLGPLSGAPAGEAWQAPVIGYGLAGDIGTPKNIGEGYRWNTKNLFYACDSTFQDYFGSNGLAAIDSAFAVYDDLGPLSSYSTNLSEWPLTTSRVNYRAQAMGLLDLKSVTMSLLAEQLGLAEPDRYVWTLHDRFLPAGGTCPLDEEYLVVKRNFDPTTYLGGDDPTNILYSSYVNGVLYSYRIDEFCTGPNPLAVTFNFPVDVAQASDALTAVAADDSLVTHLGLYYTGLTKDDVGGLRYLMDTNRLVVEAAETNSFMQITNNSLQLLETSNLNTLAAAALTNPPATLLGLFPGLVIDGFTQGFSNIVTTNIFAYITNFAFSPPGSATLVIATNFTTNVIPVFFYQFGNVITNNLYANGFITIQTISNGVPPYSPPGTTPVSITNNQTFEALFPNGTYFLLPTNALCGFSIVSTQLITVTPITNVIVTATVAPGTVNSNNLSFTESIITYATNYFLVVSIPQCSNTNTVALREGIDKINFFRRDFDSLLSQLWTPITNTYKLTAVTNNGPVVQTFFRVVTQPDILLAARDFDTGPSAIPVDFEFFRTIAFDTSQTPAPIGGLPIGGPGNIRPPLSVVYEKAGPVYFNPNTFFIGAGGVITNAPLTKDEGTGFLDFLWGTYDGTTNDPVVYPNGTSLANIENQVFLQILVSGPLQNGNANQPYDAQLQASGFQGPFNWSLAPGSPGLPPGLAIVAESNTQFADITGTPTSPGIYDFFIQVQDQGGAGRITQREFSIEIDP